MVKLLPSTLVYSRSINKVFFHGPSIPRPIPECLSGRNCFARIVRVSPWAFELFTIVGVCYTTIAKTMVPSVFRRNWHYKPVVLENGLPRHKDRQWYERFNENEWFVHSPVVVVLITKNYVVDKIIFAFHIISWNSGRTSTGDSKCM